MTALDKRILNRLQDDIPFTTRPWEAIAAELNISEDLLLKRIVSFKKTGIIRRISAIFAPRKIKFTSTLVGVKAEPEKIKEAVQKINSYFEVTHNYKRNAEYNIWFTLVAKDRKRIDEIISSIRKDKSIRKLTEFPMVKLFKINVKFTI